MSQDVAPPRVAQRLGELLSAAGAMALGSRRHSEFPRNCNVVFVSVDAREIRVTKC